MGCDMVVALGRATASGHTLFGHNSNKVDRDCPALRRTPGRSYPLGEKTVTQFLELPQARQTYTVVACQTPGLWGYPHGLNEYGVAVGCGTTQTRLAGGAPGLLGTDLVRLALERSQNARQAVDLVCDLIKRHGLCSYPKDAGAEPCGHSFLVADGREAFVVEASSRFWVTQEVREVRTLSDVCTVRQDWDRISVGLADLAITQGWWPGDGSKLDFAGAVALRTESAGTSPQRDSSALRRWGRSTLLMEEQNGHIDVAFVRRLLSDHYEGCPEEVDPLDPSAPVVPICQHGNAASPGWTAASFVADVPAGSSALPMAWWAAGPPCRGVYFPVFLDADLPGALCDTTTNSLGGRLQAFAEYLGRNGERWALVQDAFTRLQARFDQETEEFAAEATTLRQRSATTELERLAGAFMQHNVERFEEVVRGLLATGWRRTERPTATVGVRS